MIFQNFLKNPILFILRQLYRIFVIFPFNAILSLASLFDSSDKIEDYQQSSFCFLITSVIYPKPGKQLQYNAPRSVFSPEDRAKQTLQTVESIYAKVPGAKVVLIESGLQENLPYDLPNKVDQYIYVGNKKLVRLSCDSKQKSLGEIMMIYYALKKLKFRADLYFKMSGRYFLNDEFNLDNWKEGPFTIQYIKEDYICTRLYGFRKEVFGVWKRALLKGIPLTAIAYPIENTLAKFIPRKLVRRLNRLGVSGIGASSNEIIKD